MLYVPNYDSNNCVVLLNSETIRVYDYKPYANTNVHFVDYYINSHYISQDGYQQFSNYYTSPICQSELTTNVMYRNDYSDILIIFIILAIVIVVVPTKIVFRLFRRLK